MTTRIVACMFLVLFGAALIGCEVRRDRTRDRETVRIEERPADETRIRGDIRVD
jgi:hypothetical protein